MSTASTADSENSSKKIDPGRLEKFTSYINTNCNDYRSKCQALLDSLKSEDENEMVTKYRELLSFTHDSADEINKSIEGIFLSKESKDDVKSKLKKTECSQLRRDSNYKNLMSWYKSFFALHDSDDEFAELPRHQIKPWTGYKDERSAPFFLFLFIIRILPWCSNDKIGIREFILHLQGPDVQSFISRVDPAGTLETVLKNFYDEFANEHVFCQDIVNFTLAKYPRFPRQKVSEFVSYWVNRMSYNPKITIEWFASMLPKKLPERYSTSLQIKLDLKYLSSMSDILAAVHHIENLEDFYSDQDKKSTESKSHYRRNHSSRGTRY